MVDNGSNTNKGLRKMNPATIRGCIHACADQYSRDEVGMAARIATFLATWSTWEALRTRYIRVAIHHQGWLIKDADTVLATARISSMKRAAEIIALLGITHPAQWSGDSGTVWRALQLIEPIRHKLTHGFRTTDPQKVRLATAITLAALKDHRWLETTQIRLFCNGNDVIKVGSILQPRTRSNISPANPVEELFSCLNIQPIGRVPVTPSMNKLEKLLLTIERRDPLLD